MELKPCPKISSQTICSKVASELLMENEAKVTSLANESLILSPIDRPLLSSVKKGHEHNMKLDVERVSTKYSELKPRPKLCSKTSCNAESELLTENETEVAWLAEESLLLDPIDGPLLSFVTQNASQTLKSVIDEI
jgi:hypothetical protein